MSHLNVTFDATATTPTIVEPRLPVFPGTESARAVWSSVNARADMVVLAVSGIIGWAGVFYLLWLLGGMFNWR
jgi:hypothetical protein